MLRGGCQSELPSVPSPSKDCQSLPWRTQYLEALPRHVGRLAGDAAERGGLIAVGERGKPQVVVLRAETDATQDDIAHLLAHVVLTQNASDSRP